ncbi:hypothetical protein KFU94_64295 [Chloroflexi bacterium TSY]|nr:hypothetical protein [Chloroflexi bacterium TSY]
MKTAKDSMVGLIGFLTGATAAAALVAIVVMFLISNCSYMVSQWQTTQISKQAIRANTEQVRIVADAEIKTSPLR